MEINELIKKFKSSKKKLVLLDYDGTLVNFESTPEAASPPDRLLAILSNLCKRKGIRVAIITGRSKESIEHFVGHLALDIIAEHGANIRLNKEWKNQDKPFIPWKEEIVKLLEKYVRDCPLSFIEEKSFAVSWHYRSLNEQEGWLKSRRLIEELNKKGQDFKIIDGSKVVEITVRNTDKGVAAIWMINQDDYDCVLSVGDDKTDEDMFKALREFENCYTVKVGSGATLAKHKLVNVPEVLLFLEQL